MASEAAEGEPGQAVATFRSTLPCARDCRFRHGGVVPPWGHKDHRRSPFDDYRNVPGGIVSAGGALLGLGGPQNTAGAFTYLSHVAKIDSCLAVEGGRLGLARPSIDDFRLVMSAGMMIINANSGS